MNKGAVPIVKCKASARHGDYCTERVILEMHDAMAEAKQGGAPYHARSGPLPADPQVAHTGNAYTRTP